MRSEVASLEEFGRSLLLYQQHGFLEDPHPNYFESKFQTRGHRIVYLESDTLSDGRDTVFRFRVYFTSTLKPSRDWSEYVFEQLKRRDWL